jgi:hypothetical protein
MRCEGSLLARLFHGAWAPARLRSGWQNLRRLRWRGFMRAPRRSEAPSRWSAADPMLVVMRSHSCGYALVGLLLARAPKAVGRDRLALTSMCQQAIADEDDDVQVCTLPKQSCALLAPILQYHTQRRDAGRTTSTCRTSSINPRCRVGDYTSQSHSCLCKSATASSYICHISFLAQYTDATKTFDSAVRSNSSHPLSPLSPPSSRRTVTRRATISTRGRRWKRCD